MKKFYTLIAIAMVAALSIVSCKNNKKTQEPTQEEVQEQKQALADSVLSIIDSLVVKYQEANDRGDISQILVLSDEEKLVKPDYLLDPSLVSTFVTNNQKITAFRYYLVDYLVLNAYDMPLDANKEALAKLATELNYPADLDEMFTDFTIPASEIIKQEYNAYKERNDLASFWKHQFAMLIELSYISANNPDLFVTKLTEEQHQAIGETWGYFIAAVSVLADYDEEISFIKDNLLVFNGEMTEDEVDSCYKTKENTMNSFSNDVLRHKERRNALLK